MLMLFALINGLLAIGKNKFMSVTKALPQQWRCIDRFGNNDGSLNVTRVNNILEQE